MVGATETQKRGENTTIPAEIHNIRAKNGLFTHRGL